jgi:hypothetical protein
MTKLPSLVKELRRAARSGSLQDVRRLVRYPELIDWKTDALIVACGSPHETMSVVRFLAPQCDVTVAINTMIRDMGDSP